MIKQGYSVIPQMGWARYRDRCTGSGKHAVWVEYASHACEKTPMDKLLTYAQEQQDFDAGWGNQTTAGNVLGLTNPLSIPSKLAQAGAVATRGNGSWHLYFLPDFDAVKEIRDSYEAWEESCADSQDPYNGERAAGSGEPDRVSGNRHTSTSCGSEPYLKTIADALSVGYRELWSSLYRRVTDLETRITALEAQIIASNTANVESRSYVPDPFAKPKLSISPPSDRDLSSEPDWEPDKVCAPPLIDINQYKKTVMGTADKNVADNDVDIPF